ncbi:hypothetical protein MUY27_13425 [Mucilaginibacter sp. RS28]|uniref:Uncharacterized protein n=1 Tax=Mucilaginibacter straminoryzae TaxID=2932774 RepID=A0A9X1X3W3_9SPHI|nr:hypothetical protein [Mucilaginibacter straminoryzae]MCJ8210712.1 hypothetical protein [Mucilaginibacter straminoryzae]
MKKLSLSVLAIAFAATSLMANNVVVVKKAKAKQTSCCSKENCTKKADCPKPTKDCPCK